MSYGFDTRFGEHLYKLLPEVYRTRDKSSPLYEQANAQPLARYLDSHGHLLDLIHATLEQQHLDAIPVTSQEWLLPYFAKLLAVKIVSPDHAGRHNEVSNAIAWRQRKGTLSTVESIAESVGQMEVEVQEGWKRVITTAKLDRPFRQLSSFDSSKADFANPEMEPQKFVEHPGMGIATIDFRRPSKAVASQPENPASKLSNFAGVNQLWRQLNPNGVPCISDGFDDVSGRTVDINSVGRGGVYHHKNLLLFAAPSSGLFRLPPIELNWEERHLARYKEIFKEEIIGETHFIINVSNRVVIIKDLAELTTPFKYHIESIDFAQELVAESGSRFTLKNIQAKKVTLLTADLIEPVLEAEDCLFEELSIGSGLAKLERCSVLQTGYLNQVDITDSIIMAIAGADVSGIVQFSRIPELIDFSHKDLTIEDSTFESPIFFESESELGAQAVLRPGCPTSILFGSSGQTEMGYFCNGRKQRPVFMHSSYEAIDGFALAGIDRFVFKDLVFMDKVSVTSGSIYCERCAFIDLTVESSHVFGDGEVSPVIQAKDSIFKSLVVPQGLAQLEFVTVMSLAHCKYLRASDCIFAGEISEVKLPTLADGAPGFRNCIRYSKVPEVLVNGIDLLAPNDPIRKVAYASGLVSTDGKPLLFTNTAKSPVFSEYHYCHSTGHSFSQAEFGDYGYGVLAQSTSSKIRFGSEDGGEMGAYHHKLYSLRTDALMKKVEEFLPVGIQPVLIEDSRLLHIPTETSLTSE